MEPRQPEEIPRSQYEPDVVAVEQALTVKVDMLEVIALYPDVEDLGEGYATSPLRMHQYG
jgi:hypothetical protein